MPEYSDEILDSNQISSTDKEGRPIPVTIPIALAPGITDDRHGMMIVNNEHIIEIIKNGEA